MLNRHGLIAGATGTGKTKTLQLMAGQLSKAGVPVFVADIKGDLTGLAAPGDAKNPKLLERVASLGLDLRGVGSPGGVPVAVGHAGSPGQGDRAFVRAAAARQGARPERDADVDPRARLQVLRRQRPALAGPQGPRDHAEVPVVRRGQAHPRGVRRDVERVGRRAPPVDGRPRAGGRRRLLRRARIRGRGPPSRDTGWRGRDQRPRALGRHGQAPALQHVHALDARAALREPPGGGRSAQAEAVLLLRRGASAVRRRLRSADGPGRAHRAPDPLQGRRRLLRDPGAHRRPLAGPGAARQPRATRPPRVHPRRCRCVAQDGPDLPDDRLLRRRTGDHVPRDRGGARDRACRRGACPRHSPRLACSPRIR